MAKRVTIVCCTNNYEQLNRELLYSLSTQNEPYEIIIIDNRNKKYSSCSKALNSVIDDITTKYVIYSHQDIILKSETCIKEFVDYMKQSELGDIFGVAGTRFDSRGVLTSISHGIDSHPAGRHKLIGIEECDVVDECFFGGLTETFRKYPFNEELCDNWHLYSVDRCLNCKIHGHKVFVCEIPLIHTSTGTLNRSFNITFRNICKKYHNYFSEIYTTCDRSKTSFYSRNIHFFIVEIMRLLEGFKHK